MKPLSRRTLIRGVGGVAIALPFLDAMRPRHAWAQEQNPKRLIAWYSGNGQMPEYWYPAGSGTTFALNTAHQALEPYKSKLILFNGVKNDAGNDPAYGGHQGSFCSMLSGAPFTQAQSFNTMRPTTASIDQLVADKIGGTTRLPLLATGVVPAGSGDGNILQAIGSWRGENDLIPPITDPAAVFDRLFMDGAPDDSQDMVAAENLRRLRMSVLDGVVDRFAALEARVGSEDKARLQQHMTSIREIEQQVVVAQPQVSCTIPTRPADEFDVGGSNIPAWGQVNLDLMVMALACDVTRVANFFWFAMGSGGVTFSWLGHTNTHHNLAHENAVQQMTEINTWFSTQLAYVMSSLDQYTEIDGGSMLDNTLILWWNELGDGAAHISSPAPYVLAGGAGADLQMGRYLDYEGQDVQNSQILLSVYNVLTGSQDQVFGSEEYCPGPAPEL